jgi:hypothetical protein
LTRLFKNLRVHLSKLHFFKTMPALSFSVFKDKILDGSKRQTIRAVRKRAIATGDKLFLYWKQQSPKDCEKLGEATCIKVAPITITELGASCEDIGVRYYCLDLFAQADGFDDWDEMREYFDKNYGLPFTGVLIEWDSIVRDVDPELVEALNERSFRTDYRGNDEDSDDGFIEPITPQWLLDDEGMIIGTAYL